MRTAVALALGLLLAAAPGCYVVEEIDAGMKKWEHNSPKQKKPEAPPAGELARSPSDAKAARDAWWQKARTIDSGDLSPDIVSCEIGGSTQFMRESDCAFRGGRPR
jgi:hypothetical protein